MSGRHTFLGGVTRQQTVNILHKHRPISDQPIFRTHTHTIAVRCVFSHAVVYKIDGIVCGVIFTAIEFVHLKVI